MLSLKVVNAHDVVWCGVVLDRPNSVQPACMHASGHQMLAIILGKGVEHF